MDQLSADRNHYFEQLDGFRCIAIFAVMITHFTALDFVSRFPLGYAVLFFFVLSSFLITRILIFANERQERSKLFKLKQFYVRRTLRIFPVYYLTVCVLFIINFRPCRQIIGYLISYTVNFKIASGFEPGSFNHLWSLSVEEQYYIVIPFFILFTDTKYLLKIFSGFIFLGLIGKAILFHYDRSVPFSSYNTISCLDSLGIGGILGYLSIYKPAYLKKIISAKSLYFGSVILFLLLMIFSYSIYSTNEKINFISMVFLKFLFNIMCFWILGYSIMLGYGGIIKQILENHLVIYLGRISYGMYLFHLFIPVVIRVVCNHFKIDFFNRTETLPIVVSSIVFILVTIACASVSWILIEKPLKKYRHAQEFSVPG